MVSSRVRVKEWRSVAKLSGLGFAIFLLTSLTPAGAQQPANAPAAPSVAPANETNTPVAAANAAETASGDYTVSPEDLLDINVLDVPEVTRNYRVSSNGFLTLPLLPEPIPAAGESLDQLAHIIAAKFHDAGMLSNAQVTVSLIETKLHTVLVSGEVKRPQAYPLFGPTRLLDILVQAGGLENDAGDDAFIMRGEIGARADMAESARADAMAAAATGLSFTLNIRKLLQTGDDTTNILLYPGDRVTVQRAALVYVLGAVVHPGGYVLSEANQRITVLKALAMAGDVTNIAKKSRLVLLRRDPAGPGEKRNEIDLDYKAMVRGQTADMRLNPDDILYVPESSGLKAWHTSVNSAVSMVTMAGPGLMIYH